MFTTENRKLQLYRNEINHLETSREEAVEKLTVLLSSRQNDGEFMLMRYQTEETGKIETLFGVNAYNEDLGINSVNIWDVTKIENDIKTLEDKVNVEVEEMLSILQNADAIETVERKSEDSKLQDAINAEVDRATKAEATLTNTINNVESDLRKSITANTQAIQNAVNNAKSYTLTTASSSEVSSLGTNVREAYKLVDEDNTKVGEYIKIYKDSALQKVELSGQTLVFTYLLVDGTTQVVNLDVSKFLVESEFKNGLQVNNGEVSVKVDASSEAFLSVSANGIKVSGIQSAINTEVTKIQEVNNNLTTALADEIARAKNAETALTTNLNNEVTRAKDAEATLNEAITKEVTDRTNADNALQTAITSETTARQNADTTLQTAINSEVTTRQNADNVISGQVTANTSAIATLNGTGNGSVAKAVADAKSALESQINDTKITGITVNTVNGSISNNKASVTINAGDVKLASNYTPTTYPNEGAASSFTEVASSDNVNKAIQQLDTNIGKILTEILSNEKTITEALSTIRENSGLNTNGTYTPISNPKFLENTTSLYDAIIALANKFVAIETRLSALESHK